MRRWLFALVLTLVPATGFAQSQVPSLRDVVELTKAGLADDVILTLIEVNGSVYPTDAETLKSLKAAGVSPAVIVALVKSGRQNAAVPAVQDALSPVTPSEPEVIVVEREAPEPRVREVVVPVPVYVAVPAYRSHRRPEAVPHRPVEPVYWGWGGKLRPDAWKPFTAADVQKDAKIPEAQRR